MVTQTDIEQLVEAWLIRNKTPYESQVSLRGGVFELGGSKVDFIVEGSVCLRVQGSFWHSGVEKTGSDAVQRELLEADEWVVVDLFEDDIKTRLDETMRLAIKGQEMIR